MPSASPELGIVTFASSLVGLEPNPNCMKRLATTILIIGTFAFITNELAAQVRVGGKVGANYFIGGQKIQPDPKDPPTNPKGLGLAFGAYVEIPFSDMVGIRPELEFSFRKLLTEQSVTQKFDNTQVTYNGQPATFTGEQTILTETDQRLSYFQINAPITLTATEGLRVMIGPSFGFLMSGKRNEDVTTTTKGTLNGNTSLDQNDFETSKKKGSAATKDFKKMEMAAMAGVGYTLDVGLDLDLRYYRGLSTTFDQSQGSSRYRIWSNLVEFAVGWTFGGG